jgi:hypothetical protein
MRSLELAPSFTTCQAAAVMHSVGKNSVNLAGNVPFIVSECEYRKWKFGVSSAIMLFIRHILYCTAQIA